MRESLVEWLRELDPDMEEWVAGTIDDVVNERISKRDARIAELESDRRREIISNSSIDLEVALRVFGDPDVNLCDDTTRRAFFAVWALLQVEYADALIREMDKNREL